MDWTETDYIERTIDQILQRGGGNCYEQAFVVEAVLKQAGIETRQVREINIQPSSDERQRDAEALIAEHGNALSVFGRRHNDHVWIEYWNGETGEWAPADPTLNLVGYDEWVRARMGYKGRPVHEIIPSRDMLVPIAIFAVNKSAKGGLENRSSRYLVEEFSSILPNEENQDEWQQWVEGVNRFSEHALAAFDGEYNLHIEEPLIEQMAETYKKLEPLDK